MNKSEDWDKKEQELDDYDRKGGNYKLLVDNLVKAEREIKYLELRLKQNEDDLQFMSGKLLQVLKTLDAYGIKV